MKRMRLTTLLAGICLVVILAALPFMAACGKSAPATAPATTSTTTPTTSSPTTAPPATTTAPPAANEPGRQPLIVTSITVTPAPPPDLKVGATQKFEAAGIWYGVKTPMTTQSTWTSSNPGVATISNVGLATGVAAGKTEITASAGTVTSPPVTLTVVAP